MPLVKVQGIVLKHINLGEADKIITLFTDKLGKISAVAHGARKPKSRVMSSTQVFSYCEYVLYKGKSLYTINQSEIKESFQQVLKDLYTLTYCSYLTELVDTLTQEGENNVELFRLLLKTMYMMTEETADKELVVRYFELNAMSISGYMPDLYRCTVCSEMKGGFTGFSSSLGGLVCGDCMGNVGNAVRIDVSALNVMRYLLRTSIDKIHMLKVSERDKNNMKKIMKNYIKYYLERDFKSLDFLDDIMNVHNKKE